MLSYLQTPRVTHAGFCFVQRQLTGMDKCVFIHHSRRMPTVLRIGDFRFFFYSREGTEPRHIHVEQAERYAKFWLEPIALAESRGFRSAELRLLHSMIAEHRQRFILAWDEHFGQ